MYKGLRIVATAGIALLSLGLTPISAMQVQAGNNNDVKNVQKLVNENYDFNRSNNLSDYNLTHSMGGTAVIKNGRLNMTNFSRVHNETQLEKGTTYKITLKKAYGYGTLFLSSNDIDTIANATAKDYSYTFTTPKYSEQILKVGFGPARSGYNFSLSGYTIQEVK